MITLSKTRISILLLLAVGVGVALAFLLFNRSLKSEFSNYEGFNQAFSELPRDEAKRMVDHYQEQIRTSGTGQGVPSVRSVHFEFGALAKYLIKMKTLRGATGVRLYFGRYYKDENRTVEGQPINLKEYNTLIFVTTKKDKEGKIIDILTDEKGKPLILYEPYNGGVSCPPYPPKYCEGQGL